MATEESKSPWFSTLFILTVIQASIFVSVTVIEFCTLYDIEELDTNLDNRLLALAEPHVRERRDVNNKRFTGLLGEILLAQEKIIAQHCQHKDHPCQLGDPGDKGPKGVAGQKGERGEIGIDGETGVNGSPGEKGDAGPQGLPGKKGEPGNIGERGPQGPKGVKGEHGIQGVKGPKGAAGIKGSIGDTGTSGQKGDPGLPGLKGSVGDRGNPGNSGLSGPKGETGQPGKPGKDIKMIPDGCECLKPPKFKTDLRSDMYILRGTNKKLSCQATGNPKPQVTITRISRRRSSTQLNTSNGKMQVFTNFDTNDVGKYKCVATNKVGTTEQVINVITGEPPVFTTTPTDLELRSGTSVQIECAASGTPPPTISFVHNGHALSTTLRFFVQGGHLTIRNTAASDSGTYNCLAQNEFGNVTSSPWRLQIV